MIIDLKQGLNEFRKKLLEHMPHTGDYSTEISKLVMFRRDEAGVMENCVLEPLATLVVEGSKRSALGNQEYNYGAGSCLISGVDMPCISYITEASPERPFLSISIRIDRALIRHLASEMPAPAHSQQDCMGFSVAPAEAEVVEAFLRIADLLDKPDRISILAPLITKEIHYCLLMGRQGAFLGQLRTADSLSSQIAQAVCWLRDNFREPFLVDDLAHKFNMLPSTLHRHFKRITSLSPLQYQKKLRLHEAQRLMLADDLDATSASYAVGYESPYQFNREYKRQFGLPPYKDIMIKRTDVKI